MNQISMQLQDLVRSTFERLSNIREAEANRSVSEGKWSRKEIIGHLVDSATNNHQRFVRTALNEDLRHPTYEQTSWVNIQKYGQESWQDLVELWKTYNLHIAHVMDSIPEERLKNHVVVGNNDPVTLKVLMEDYVEHLRKHVGQLQL